jgi:radical SAM protein with 4Fe4S-binding SPASM domain
LDYVDIVKIVENAGNIKVGCVVGGEIFTRPDMMDILHYMDDKGIYLKISTNGYHLTDRMILDIARLKHVANIAVSIDGTQDMHNRLRGRPDAFQQTVAATRKFKNLGLKVLGCTVLMPENVMTIRDILEVFNELKVDRVTLHPMSYGRAGEFEKVQKRVDFTKLYAQKKAADYTPLTLNQMENVKAAMEIYRRKGLFCVLYPAHAMNNTEGFLNDTVGNKFICKQFYSATVNERGEVLPCLYMSKSFGNLLEKPMSEIWNSKDARDFRKSFANDGAFPYCYRCCSARII